MTSYVYGSDWSYKDFLRAKKFHDSITMAIETQTLKQIATAEELARDGARILLEALEASTRQVVSAVDNQTEQLAKRLTFLHYGLAQVETAVGSVRDAVKDQTALLDWRLSGVIGELGEVNTHLDTLIKLARTPSQTWAYEQFDIAREAFNRGLFREALTALDHATNGFESHTGYSLEPRFHYLSGTIYLTAQSEDEDFIDLAAAEKAFSRSAQVARKHAPEMASRGYCAAGYAAYCQGAIERARTNLDVSKSLCPKYAEASFLSGKIYAHCGSIEAAIRDLITAIKIDRRYVLRASSDKDYKTHAVIIDNAIDRVEEEIRRIITKATEVASSKLKQLHEICLPLQQTIANTPWLSPILSESHSFLLLHDSKLKQTLDEINKALQTETLFGMIDAQILSLKLDDEIRIAKLKISTELKDISSIVKTGTTRLISNKQQEKFSKESVSIPPYPNLETPVSVCLKVSAIIYIIISLTAIYLEYERYGIRKAAALLTECVFASPFIVGSFGVLIGSAIYLFILAGHEWTVHDTKLRVRSINAERERSNAEIDAAILELGQEKHILDNAVAAAEVALEHFDAQTNEGLHFSPIGLSSPEAEPWGQRANR